MFVENDDIPTLSCDRSKPTIPRIVTWGPTLLEFSDRDVILPCSAIGNPTPEIYWINNKNTVIDVDTISSHYKVSWYICIKYSKLYDVKKINSQW